MRKLILLAGLLLSLQACYLEEKLQRSNPYDDQFDATINCRADTDCARVGFCVQGKCAQCKDSNDCADQKACVQGVCQTCQTAKDCGGGLACLEGKCLACKVSADCGGAGQVCRDGTCSPCESEEAGTCILTGTYTDELKLTADIKWILRGAVFIGDDVKSVALRIEPGTTIVGEKQSTGVLIVRRNGKIFAEGTREKPIVFTSSQPKGQRQRGDWGGLVINGNARLNNCVGGSPLGICEGFGEGGTGWYGGTNDNDSSGVLRYVRVEFAGRLFSPDNELNGIAFQAVGSGTTVEYVQVHMNADDGVEFFGGTVSFKYILVTGAEDDSLDWTDGWRGNGQFFIAQQYTDGGDCGIEADNQETNFDATPRSGPTLSNLTFVGGNEAGTGAGARLRRGTGAKIYNAIFMNYKGACLRIDDADTYKNGWDTAGSKLNGELVVSNSIIQCPTNFKGATGEGINFTIEDFFNALNPGNLIGDPMLTAPTNYKTP
ncbi:MAG: hypothetical protein H6727_03400, partial [Myxococcales bacterium]|nr:hypothetical protein [Myxococcales bacterium]